MEDGKTSRWSTADLMGRYPMGGTVSTGISPIPARAAEDYLIYKAICATVSPIEQSRANGKRAREALEKAADLAAKKTAEEELITATEQILDEPARSGTIYASSEPQFIGAIPLRQTRYIIGKQEWEDILKWDEKMKMP